MRSKRKWLREKVTAEITMAHVQQFVQEMGTNMSAAEVAQFLNENGRAQNVWTHMMQGAELYIKASLPTQAVGISAVNRPGVQATMIQ